MPAFFDLSCAECNESVEEIFEVGTFVILDDGSVVPLGHPREPEKAMALTGIALDELVEQERVVFDYALLCDDCGSVQRVRTTDHPELSGGGPFSSRTFHRATETELAHIRCSTCQHRRLRPLPKYEDYGWHPGWRCPTCGHRSASLRMAGHS